MKFSESAGSTGSKSRNPKSNLKNSKNKKSKRNKIAPESEIPTQKSVKIAANPKTGKPGNKKTIKKKKKTE